MKKVTFGIKSLVFITVAVYFLVPNIMMKSVKDKVLENNTDIDEIVTINHISSWGEWFLEYELVIKIDGQKFRIWTNNKGEIIEKELL